VGTIIDTSVFIAVERGELNPARLTREDDDDIVVMAAMTASELLHGVHRLKGAVVRARAERFVEHLLATVAVIPFDLDVARIHARLGADLAVAGKAVGGADLQIAATAVWLDYRIATRDLRSFPRIAGLDVVRW
jgi:predicted nucleic acid-binding protein